MNRGLFLFVYRLFLSKGSLYEVLFQVSHDSGFLGLLFLTRLLFLVILFRNFVEVVASRATSGIVLVLFLRFGNIVAMFFFLVGGVFLFH